MNTLVPALLVFVFASALHAQADRGMLARQIASERVEDRAAALAVIARIRAQDIGPELRAAMINALDREAALHIQTDERLRRGEKGARPVEHPEFLPALSRAVVRLRDPAAIPALVTALFTGTVVPRALADFGEQAASAVVRLVETPGAWHNAVDGGLISLRFMIEGRERRPLSPATLDQIRQVARQRLTGRQYFTVLWRAIDLAMALDDPELTAIVSMLAYDAKAVRARGVTDPDLVERTQQLARDRLAGMPAKPPR